MIKHTDLSLITDYLYVSSLPKKEHVMHIVSLGVRMIISMPPYKPPSEYRQPPFKFVHCPSLDSRWTPIPMFILRRGVSAAGPVIKQGDAVLVHCKEGMHRSVAMACSILISQGYTAEAAMNLVKEKRDKADPYAPHIRKRIEKFESYWVKHHG